MTKPKIRALDPQTKQRYEAMIASTVLLDLNFHRFGESRGTNLKGVKMETHLNGEGDTQTVALSPAAFKLSRRLLDLEVGLALRSLFNRTSERIKRISVPSFDRPGVFRLSYAAVDTAEAILQDALTQLEPLKVAFREAYDSEVQKMRTLQGDKFNPKDYPSAWLAGERWGIEWAYLETATVPKSLRGVNQFIYKRAVQQAAERAKLQFDAVEQTLRAGVLACVDKMKADLQATTPLGRPRAYSDKALAKVDQFFSNFPLRNVINDGVSAEAMKAMRALLRDVPVAGALDDEFLRKQTVDGLAALADSIRPYVSEQAVRAIALPDDDA